MTAKGENKREVEHKRVNEARAALVKHYFINPGTLIQTRTPAGQRSIDLGSDFGLTPQQEIRHSQYQVNQQWMQIVLNKCSQSLFDAITNAPEWDNIVQTADVISLWTTLENTYIKGTWIKASFYVRAFKGYILCILCGDFFLAKHKKKARVFQIIS